MPVQSEKRQPGAHIQVASPVESIVIAVVAEAYAEHREPLLKLLRDAGYQASVSATAEDTTRIVRDERPDLLLLFNGPEGANLLSQVKELPSSSPVRVMLLTSSDAAHRAEALLLGADDVVIVPWDDEELLARVRTQLRQKRAINELDRKVRNAEESYQVAQTAFQALAVTEKMTRDAFSLERILKTGVGVLLALALVIAAIFFSYSRKADKETKRAYSVISQLERNFKNEEQLLAATRRLRGDPTNTDVLQQKEQLKQQAETLKQKLSAPDGNDVGELRRQLEDATTRLSKLEGSSQAAEMVIHEYAPSVCLLHVSVAFNAKDTNKRLRYGGIDSDGSPLKDSDGNTVYTTDGHAPEVRADFFGTGFIAAQGKILTNHHVVQPWWENDDLKQAQDQGLEPVLAEITAYFPGTETGIPMAISQISETADLAVLHGDLSELKRPTLKLDSRKEAAVSGDALISLGYATGIDAILARAGDETVRDVVRISGGDPKLVLSELARRKLIRPLVTQGHVGDVLPDKIVYDAQTTSGGSGGPLLNSDGGVIGVTFAIVKGFGGSNFGVPVRYAEPLLKH